MGRPRPGPGVISWFKESAFSDDDISAQDHEYGHNQGFGHEMREVCPVGQFHDCQANGNSRATPVGAAGDHFAGPHPS